MKIAVITAVFGGMDAPKPFAPQSVECDRIFITEENTPVPLPNLPPRLQAKYFKLQAHRVWPEYDIYVWIDGNIEVKSADFVKTITEDLQGIRIQKHHERQTIEQEIEHILASDNPYVTTRYGNQPLKQEYEYYLINGMRPDAPLYSCNIFSFHCRRWALLDAWWRLVLQWSWFDQSAFSFVAKTMIQDHIETVDFGAMLDNDYFTLHPHGKWQQ